MDSAQEKSIKRRNYMLEGNLLPVIITIAIPQVISMMVDSAYNMVDAFYVSRIGEAAIAAVGVNDSLMMIIRAISMGFGMGSASFISRALGPNRDEDASRAAVTTLVTAVATMVVVAVAGSLYLLPLVNFLGATDTVRPFSMQYARWILLSAPIAAANTVIGQTLRSEGSTLYSMIGMTSGCILNIAIDPIFIFTLNQGVAGAAMAKGICNLFSLAILLAPFIRGKTVIRLKLSYFSPTRELYGEIAQMGIPTMLRTSMFTVSSIIINNLAASFGDATMAAVSVSNRSLRMAATAIMGFGLGFQPVAGYCFGAKKYSRTLTAYKYTLIIGTVSGFVLGGSLGIFAPELIGVFSRDAEVMALGLVFIRTQSATLIPHVWVMITSGFFQALGKGVRAGVMGLSRQLFVLIPCVLILTRFWGQTGLASAQALADVVSLGLAGVLVVPTIKELNALRKSELGT